MTDELNAFFAKKSKGKKKGVIKLQEVVDQLEKRAKIQDELDEIDAKTAEMSISKTRITNDTDDSEWLDFDAPMNLHSTFIKEMDDIDIESDEVEERTNIEPAKTWNINNENVESVSIVQKGKYVPKTLRNPLDISNEFMFPSLDNAAEVEKEQKKELEEKRRIELEDKRKKEEEQKQIEEYNARRYKLPRPQIDRHEALKTETEANTTTDWRLVSVPSKQTKERQIHHQKIEDDGDGVTTNANWRSAPKPTNERGIHHPKIETETDDGDTADANWRSAPKPMKERMEISHSKMEADDDNNEADWRSGPPTVKPAKERQIHHQKIKTETDDGDGDTTNANWRSAPKPAKETMKITHPKMEADDDNTKADLRSGTQTEKPTGRYVPPYLRDKQ